MGNSQILPVFSCHFFPVYFQPNVVIIYWSSPSFLKAQFISMSNRSGGQSLFQTRSCLVCKRWACFIEGCIIVFGVFTSTLFINVTFKIAVKNKYSPRYTFFVYLRILIVWPKIILQHISSKLRDYRLKNKAKVVK